MVSSELPQEILIDIFSRLPAKSVGQCRCLSKPWRDILSSSQFIKSHLDRKILQQNLILISQPDHLIHTIDTIKNDAVSSKRELLDDRVEVVGCCDGLVLLENDYWEMLLVNPVTLEAIKIPDCPLDLLTTECPRAHGFGFDSSIDDYKIVQLSYSDESELDIWETFVDVYYVKRGVWKRLENSPYNHNHTGAGLRPGSLVSGALHWLVLGRESTNYRLVILAFNLADEVFTEIPVPVASDRWVFSELAVLGGCLCFFDAKCTRNNDALNIWIMKRYGSTESWISFSINAPYGWDISKLLCFIGDEELLLVIRETNGERLVIHNLKEGTLRDMIVDGVPARFMDGSTFTGSLVSPHFT